MYLLFFSINPLGEKKWEQDRKFFHLFGNTWKPTCLTCWEVTRSRLSWAKLGLLSLEHFSALHVPPPPVQCLPEQRVLHQPGLCSLWKSAFPAAAHGFGRCPKLRVAKHCVFLQWEVYLSLQTSLLNITVFHSFLHIAVPGPLPHWGWHLQALAGAGAKELQICTSSFTAFWHIAYFVCMQLITFFNDR